MKLIVGLGNPGKEYEYTRHNVGFYIIDSYLGEVNWSEKFNSLYYKTIINNENYIFLKPLTFMNNSGEAVLKIMNYFKIEPDDLLVIHDDLDLPIGKIRLKRNSSSGGHNGIKNIIELLHTQNFTQLKIGIGTPKNDTIDHVLSKFLPNELEKINYNLESIYDIIDDFSSKTVDELMSKYN